LKGKGDSGKMWNIERENTAATRLSDREKKRGEEVRDSKGTSQVSPCGRG